MIYTTTRNPALDLALLVEKLGFDDADRIEQEQLYAGGKGIDVSKMLTLAGSWQ